LHWSLTISSETKNIELLRAFLKSIFVESGLELIHFNKVFLGFSEAVCNSISHGNQFVSSKFVYVDIFCDRLSIVITVKDEGCGFDYNRVMDPTIADNLKKDSGRGIFILRNIADEVFYFDNGSRVLIKFILK